jgi:hypothetical protein
MTIHTICARKNLVALIALAAHGGVPAALCPCFVAGPNVTPEIFPILRVSPTAVLSRTSSVSGGMFSKMVFEQHRSLRGLKNSHHLVYVRFSMVTALPRAFYTGFGSFLD